MHCKRHVHGAAEIGSVSCSAQHSKEKRVPGGESHCTSAPSELVSFPHPGHVM